MDECAKVYGKRKAGRREKRAGTAGVKIFLEKVKHPGARCAGPGAGRPLHHAPTAQLCFACAGRRCDLRYGRPNEAANRAQPELRIKQMLHELFEKMRVKHFPVFEQKSRR